MSVGENKKEKKTKQNKKAFSLYPGKEQISQIENF